MNAYIIILSGVIGACLGSFLNVAAHRSIQNKSWWGNERSICESCNHVLTPIELIPIISYLMQRGKCKNCGAKLSIRYLLVEIIAALAGVIIAAKYGVSWAGLLVSAGSCGLLVNSLTDIESGDVFDLFTISTGVIGLIIRTAGGIPAIFDGALGAFAGFAVFAVIIILSRGGMGWGDAFFMGGLGGVLGLRFNLFALYLGIMIGGVWCVILMLIGRLHWGKHESIPLVPFLSLGCFITMIYGTEIFAYLKTRFIFPEIFIASWPFIK
ncbi:MAG: prepilin peptidase [Synergistaceae bacterium]|nr:prepilin peptidase [Synergistaceae bacterium]